MDEDEDEDEDDDEDDDDDGDDGDDGYDGYDGYDDYDDYDDYVDYDYEGCCVLLCMVLYGYVCFCIVMCYYHSNASVRECY